MTTVSEPIEPGAPADRAVERSGGTIETGAWRSLEPASLLVNLIPDLWRTARGAWPLLLAVFVGGGVANVVNLVLLAGFFALAVGRTVLHFLTLRYRLHEGKLEIQTGLIGRRFRVLDPARIQNVEIVQNVFHKLAGLVELRIETAGDAGAEGMLSALSVRDANLLRERLHGASLGVTPGGQSGVPVTTVGEEILGISLAELVGYGVSAGRVGAVVLAGGVAMEIFAQVSPATMAQGFSSVRPGAAIGLGLVALAGGYTFSVAGTILRHYHFRLFRSPRGLRFEAGLLTRRGVEMPLGKVQVVRVEEPWLRRLMGYGTVVVETAASGAPGEAPTPEGLLPMVPTEDQAMIAGVIFPALDVDPWATPLLPPAPRALVRACIGGGLRWGAIGTFLAWWLGPAALLVIVIGVLLGWLDWRRQGWLVTPGFVVARSGFLTRRTWIVPRNKIQSVHLLSDPLLRRHQLARVVVWVAGTSVGLPALREADATRIFEDLGRRRRALPDEPVAGGNRREDARDVRDQPGGNGVAGLQDVHRAEVDGEHVEGGLGGALHGAGDLRDERVGAVGLRDLAGEREGAGAGEGAQEREGEHLGGHPDVRDGRPDELDERLHGAAGAEHADGGEDGDQVRDDPQRR